MSAQLKTAFRAVVNKNPVYVTFIEPMGDFIHKFLENVCEELRKEYSKLGMLPDEDVIKAIRRLDAELNTLNALGNFLEENSIASKREVD